MFDHLGGQRRLEEMKALWVLLALVLQCCCSLPTPSADCRGNVLRIRGGAAAVGASKASILRNATAAATEPATSLKDSAARRLEQAKAAGKAERTSLSKSLYRIFSTITNRLGITGSSTRIVNGKIVLRRNPVQKLFHMFFLFLRAIYLFFKTLVVPLKTLEKPKSGGGPGRGSFSQINKKREMRMADLPPMPGG